MGAAATPELLLVQNRPPLASAGGTLNKAQTAAAGANHVVTLMRNLERNPPSHGAEAPLLQRSGQDAVLKVPGNLRIAVGGRMDLSSGGEVNILAGSNATVRAGGRTSIDSSGETQVRGAIVRLNGGKKPILVGTSKASAASRTVLAE